MANAWIEYIKKISKETGKSFKEAMSIASERKKNGKVEGESSSSSSSSSSKKSRKSKSKKTMKKRSMKKRSSKKSKSTKRR
jgi:hypothetical protein